MIEEDLVNQVEAQRIFKVQIDRLESELILRTEQNKDLEENIEEINSTIQRKQRVIEKQTESIKGLNQQLREKDQKIEAINQQLREKDQQLISRQSAIQKQSETIQKQSQKIDKLKTKKQEIQKQYQNYLIQNSQAINLDRFKEMEERLQY